MCCKLCTTWTDATLITILHFVQSFSKSQMCSTSHDIRSNDIIDNFVTINHCFVFDIFSVKNVASWRHRIRHVRPLPISPKQPPQQFPIPTLPIHYDTFTELRWRLTSKGCYQERVLMLKGKSSQKRLSPTMAKCEWKHLAKPSLECKKIKGEWRPWGGGINPQIFVVL